MQLRTDQSHLEDLHLRSCNGSIPRDTALATALTSMKSQGSQAYRASFLDCAAKFSLYAKNYTTDALALKAARSSKLQGQAFECCTETPSFPLLGLS